MRWTETVLRACGWSEQGVNVCFYMHCLSYYPFDIIGVLTPRYTVLVIAWGIVNCSLLALALHYYFAKQMFPSVRIINCSNSTLWTRVVLDCDLYRPHRLDDFESFFLHSTLKQHEIQ